MAEFAQVCPWCSTPNVLNDEFCDECTQWLLLPPPSFAQLCPSCEKHNTPNSRFCSECAQGLELPRVPQLQYTDYMVPPVPLVPVITLVNMECIPCGYRCTVSRTRRNCPDCGLAFVLLHN